MRARIVATILGAFVVWAGTITVGWARDGLPIQTQELVEEDQNELRERALAALDAGRPDEGIPLAERAVELAERRLAPDSLDLGVHLFLLARLYADSSQYWRAEPLNERSLAIFEKALGPDHPSVAVALNNLAELYRVLGDFMRAKQLHERSLAIKEDALGPDHPDVATTLGGLAELYRAAGDFARAEPLFERSLAMKENSLGPNHPSVAVALNNLAELYRVMGNFARTEPLIERSLAIFEEALGPDHPSVAVVLNNLAELYRAMGDLARAEPLHERSLAIRENALGPDHPEVANTLGSLAELYRAIGDFARAEPLHERSLAIRENALGPDHPSVATTLGNLAGLYWEMGDFARAEPLFERSLTVFEEALGPDHPSVATALGNLAGLYWAMGDFARAEPLHERSVAVTERTLGSNHPKTALALNNLAVLYDTTGHTASAITLAKRAVNATQATRASIREMDEALRTSFDKSIAHHYKSLADWLIAEGRLGEATQVLDLLKEREAFDFVRRDGSDDPREGRASYTEAEAAWVARYDEITNRLAAIGKEAALLEERRRARTLDEAGEARLRVLREDVKVVNAAFSAHMDAITEMVADERGGEVATSVADEVEALGARKRTLAELGEGTVLVHYLLTEDELHAILTTSRIQLVRSVPIERDAFRSLVMRDYAGELRSPHGNPLPAARELYDLMIRPLEADLEQASARTIMFSLQGVLRYAPPAALHDGERYLIERYALALHSPFADDKLRERFDASGNYPYGTIAALGTRHAIEGFSPLPAVGRELERIVRRDEDDMDGVAPGRMVIDGAFDRFALEDAALDGFPVLHVATHFHFEPASNETGSFLLLGDGDRMSLADIRDGLDLAGVDLVTLSACETAVGSKRADGREIDGLASIALRKGARGVLATLWRVADHSTGDLMEHLYTNRFVDGASKAEALRTAQLRLLQGAAAFQVASEDRGSFTLDDDASADDRAALAEGYAHPYYWAPFILIGNWL